MHVGELFRGARRPVISFEVFPPKDEAAEARLRQVLPELVALKPAYMTCTYGAMGSTRARTIEIAAAIQRDHGLPAVSHLTCVGSSRAELDGILEQIHASGLRNVMALRGDPPKGESRFTPPPDGLAHANEMVEHIRAFEKARGLPPFGLAVAGYPEKHLEAPSLKADLDHLKRKVDAGADVVITQLFFENARFFRFRDAAQERGVRVPIVPGLLPILSAKQIRRIAALCGAFIPPALEAELTAAGNDDALAEEIGVRQAVAQARELLARGAPGIHFYVLNRSSHMQQIMAQLHTKEFI